jgi:predicted heme/steroid binding protein
VNFLAEEKKFTLQELAKFNGQNGNPAYIACNGKVYDVTDSAFWAGGDHLGSHEAGKDLTEEIDIAPHGPENLNKTKLIGALSP